MFFCFCIPTCTPSQYILYSAAEWSRSTMIHCLLANSRWWGTRSWSTLSGWCFLSRSTTCSSPSTLQWISSSTHIRWQIFASTRIIQPKPPFNQNHKCASFHFQLSIFCDIWYYEKTKGKNFVFIWALLKQRLDPLLCFFVHFVETDKASALQFIVFVLVV